MPVDKRTSALEEKDQLTVEARFHLEMAKMYGMLHDKENAVKEAKIAAELDPASIDSVKEYIGLLNNEI